jgi:hypothetical protein
MRSPLGSVNAWKRERVEAWRVGLAEALRAAIKRRSTAHLMLGAIDHGRQK